MQVAALFMTAKKLTQRLINWYMDKKRNGTSIHQSITQHTPVYYSAIKRNKILMHVGTEMNLKNMLSEKSLTQEATHCMMPFT